MLVEPPRGAMSGAPSSGIRTTRVVQGRAEETNQVAATREKREFFDSGDQNAMQRSRASTISEHLHQRQPSGAEHLHRSGGPAPRRRPETNTTGSIGLRRRPETNTTGSIGLRRRDLESSDVSSTSTFSTGGEQAQAAEKSVFARIYFEHQQYTSSTVFKLTPRTSVLEVS